MKLDDMLDLQQGWDSYNAKKINPKAIEKARAMQSLLPPGKWQAIPVADGGVQLELHEEGCDIEIYINVIAIAEAEE